jgi:hypothetical protein
MLNITTRISFSTAVKNSIKALKMRQHGSFTQASWSMIENPVKNEISGRLLANQGLKCVYCERYLIGMGHEMDHFAHKGQYPQFTFTSVNLFYSCKHCNSSARKGQKNTISNLLPYYHQCTFAIVHPYFHNPNVEIVFSDPERVYFDRPNCSQIGRDTIDFFGWDDLLYTIIRSRNLAYDRLNPLTTHQEIELIQEAIAYK